jgi:hypothetical protein
MRTIIAVTAALAMLVASGCGGGSNGEAEEQRGAQARQVRQEAQRRAVLAHRAQAYARRQAARRRARLVARRERRAREAEERRQEAGERERAEEREVEEETPPEESECDPNYKGACLDPNASDYDCEGGSGNGPLYTGEVTVVGVDHYGLDADGDGVGCEG